MIDNRKPDQVKGPDWSPERYSHSSAFQRRIQSIRRRLLPDRVVFLPVLRGPLRGSRIPVNLTKGIRPWLGIQEIEISRYFRKMAPRGGTSFDIGAHYGHYSLLLAKYGSDRVFSLEPDEERLQLLRETLRLNPKLGKTIEAHQIYAGVLAPGRTLDSFIDEDPTKRRPAFVKIDVDGPEFEVLSGAKLMLKNSRPRLIVEIHSYELEVACLSILLEFDYLYRIVNAQTVWPELRPIEVNRWIVAVHRSDPDASLIIRKGRSSVRDPRKDSSP